MVATIDIINIGDRTALVGVAGAKGALTVASIDRPDIGVQLYLLGGCRLLIGSHAVEPGRFRLRKALTLVTLLALAPSHRLHREQLLDTLWPDHEPAAAANNLRVALHAARRALAPVPLPLMSDQVMLNPEGSVWTDVEAFLTTATMALRDRDRAAGWAAIELYAGDLLVHQATEDWVTGQREALRRRYLDLLLEIADWEEAAGASDRAIVALERAIAHTPALEEAHRGLMRLYAQRGQRALARQQYAKLRQALAQTLAAAPEPASMALYEAIVADDRAHGAAILGGQLPGTALGNLPAPVTSFVGRDLDMAAMSAQLVNGSPLARLVTVTGAGGCGKTRFALQVAEAARPAFPDGIWLVELAPLAEASLVPQVIAQALAVRPAPDLPLQEALRAYLADKSLLLVLDNCEHLVEASAMLVADLLSSCPGLRVLATSRTALGLAGEHRWPLAPLTLPSIDQPATPVTVTACEAGQLFVARAGDADPSFALTATTAPTVAQICRQLDGLPLALELAAAWVGVLSIEEIAARLADQFQLLTRGRRTALPHHQTLQATYDWSYALLSPDEQIWLRRLTVFAGGWTLDAAEAVCPGPTEVNALADAPRSVTADTLLDGLARLISKSLVQVEAGASGPTRYRLLETVRVYGQRHLHAAGEAQRVSARHLDWCLTIASAAEDCFWRGVDQVAWLKRLDAEADNLRVGLAWSRAHDAAANLRLAASLRDYWHMRFAVNEGRGWLTPALTTAVTADAWRVKGLLGAGLLAFEARDRAVARQCYTEALALSRHLAEPGLTAKALRELAQLLIGSADIPAALPMLEEALTLARSTGEQHGIAEALILTGRVALLRGEYVRAGAALDESLALLRQIGNLWLTGSAVYSAIQVALLTGHYDRAEALADEEHTIAEALQTAQGACIAILDRARALHGRGDLTRAIEAYEASLARARTIKSPLLTAMSLVGLGRAMVSANEAPAAVEILEEGRALCEAARFRPGLGDAFIGLGQAAWRRGQRSQARSFWTMALALGWEVTHWPTVLASLESLARVLEADDQPTPAARLVLAAAAVRRRLELPVPTVEQLWYAALTQRLGTGDGVNIVSENVVDKEVVSADIEALVAEVLRLWPAHEPPGTGQQDSA